MKKQMKKLVLTKETVRNLNIEPGRIAGGFSDPLDGCTNSTAGCPYTAQVLCASASCDYTCQYTASGVVIQPQTRNC
ncbi:MAG TPA: hypothetical protein VLB76_08405 [Thermoanaerobaculia bacterium]|jgi:hypothetical protein|nr:hypothetical protein [Thermoanaerobaculia bacterium]